MFSVYSKRILTVNHEHVARSVRIAYGTGVSGTDTSMHGKACMYKEQIRHQYLKHAKGCFTNPNYRADFSAYQMTRSELVGYTNRPIPYWADVPHRCSVLVLLPQSYS